MTETIKNETLVKDIEEMSKDGLSDRQIAIKLSEKYDAKITRERVSIVRNDNQIPPGGCSGRPSRIFQITDENGQVIFQGTTKECADKVFMTVSGLIYRVNHPSPKWGWNVREVKE